MDFAHAGLVTKDIEGLTLLVVAVLGGAMVTCMSHRVRDVALFVILATLVFDNRMCVTFLGKWWYRGSTRGLEVTLQDILAFSLLVASIVAPRPGRSRWRWPAGLGLMLLYFLYACGSTVLIEPRVFSVYELLKIARGLMFFVVFALVVRSDRELAICVAGLALATCGEGLMSVRQLVVYHLDRVAGSLDHPNSLSMYLCMAGPVLVATVNSRLPRVVRWLCIGALALAVLPSISETFGLVLLEAWAAGAAVMASRTSGAKALIREGENGWLFDLDKPASFHEAANVALNGSGLRERFAASGGAMVQAEYDVGVVARRLRQLYYQLIEGKSCAT